MIKFIPQKTFLVKYWPLGFLLVVWLAFASPYFFQDVTPFPSSYQVNHFPPWSMVQEFWGPVKNNAMPDIVDQIYPWRFFTFEQWRVGEIAWWNPYSFSGNPHLANYQSSVFSPTNLLFFIFPFLTAWNIGVLLQSILAGLFTYFYLRRIKQSQFGALLGSVAFMYCGFIVTWMAYGTLAMAIVPLPLILLLLERAKDKFSIWEGLLLSIAIASSFFSGHFQTSLYLVIFSMCYAAFVLATTKKRKQYFFMLIFFVLGLVLSSIQLYPTVQFYLSSVRSESFNTGDGGIPLYRFITLFAPDFFGNPVTRNDWLGSYAEFASFVGVIPFFVAFFSLYKKDLLVRYFWGAAAIVFLFALSSPFQAILGNLHIPVLSTSNPTRIIVLLSFCLAVLSGFGFDSLRGLINEKNVSRIIKVVIPFMILFAAIWVSIYIGGMIPREYESISRNNFVLPTVFLTIVAGGSIILSLFGFLRKFVAIFFIFFLVVAGIDSFRFVTKWMPKDPSDRVFVTLPVIEAMRDNIGTGRMFGNLGAQVGVFYKLPVIEGYDPLYIGRYGEFIASSNTGTYTPSERSVVRITRVGSNTDRVLNLLGVSILFHPRADTNQSWAYPAWKKGRENILYQDAQFEIYSNPDALSRPSLFYNFEVIHESEELLSRFYSEDFDYKSTILLEKDPDITLNATGTGSARIKLNTPNKIVIEADSSSPALLFLSDNFYPGWKATVNNKDVEIYRANYSFRAILVPEGKSEVEFVYKGF